MVLWPDWLIVEAVKDGRVEVDPFDEGLVQPASLDVRLGGQIRAMVNPLRYVPLLPWDLEPDSDEAARVSGLFGSGFSVSDDWFVLNPGTFALGHTLETVGLPGDVAAKLEGKSSLGRLGLMVHSTAGFVDPGFRGQITLELSNVGTAPIALRAGMPVGQLAFITLSAPAARPYGSVGLGSHYRGQMGATVSRGGNGS